MSMERLQNFVVYEEMGIPVHFLVCLTNGFSHFRLKPTKPEFIWSGDFLFC